MLRNARWIAIFAILISTSTQAEVLDWTKTDELSAISQLGAGYAWAEICNLKIDTEVAARFLEEKLGRGRQYSAQQVADLMFTAIATIGLERQLVGASACPAARRNYGRGGSSPLAGLLY
jgi:hypothetical protein